MKTTRLGNPNKKAPPPFAEPQLDRAMTECLKRSSANANAAPPWLEEHFPTDASDVLLGSFVGSYRASRLLVSGRVFIVTGTRGARVWFHSDIFGIVTTRLISLADISLVRKVNKVGVVSAIELVRASDRKSYVFCSFLFRDNAFRAMHDAWRLEHGFDATTPARNDASIAHTASGDENDDDATGYEESHLSFERTYSRASSHDTEKVHGSTDSFSYASRRPTPDARENVLTKRFPNSKDRCELYDRMFDSELTLLTAHLLQNCKATNVVKSPVRDGKCFLSYDTPTDVHLPYVPKVCHMKDAQMYDRGAWMTSLAHSEGTPYADCYKVQTVVLFDVSFSFTREVSVSCHVEWLKPVSRLARRLIERGTRDKVRKSYREFFDMVEKDTKSRERAGAPPMCASGFNRSSDSGASITSGQSSPVPETNSTARVTTTTDVTTNTCSSYRWGHAVWFMPALIALMALATFVVSVMSGAGTDIVSVVPGSLQFVVRGVEPVTKGAIRSAIRRLASDDTVVDSILASLVKTL